MANYTFAALTSAVVGVASTAQDFDTQIRFARALDGVGIGSEKVLELDSMDPLSYTVGIGTTSFWYDTTKPQNNATLTGAYSFDGRNIVFGDTGYANLVDSDDFTFAGDFAIEVSFNMTGTANATYPSALVASWAEFGNVNNKLILFINSVGQFALQINGEGNTFVYPKTISLNTNYHTVITRRSGVIKWYLNNELGSEINYADAIEPVLDYRIGSYSASSGQSFEGKIDLVRFYRDRALSVREVKESYDASINRSIISLTNGTRPMGNLTLSNTSGYPAIEASRPVVGQLYPRFTK